MADDPQAQAATTHSEDTAARRRTAVVTGAGSGIGEACARVLAADGFDVVLGGRRTDRIETVAAQINAGHTGAGHTGTGHTSTGHTGPGRATARRLDVTDQASVSDFVDAAGPVDVLVNNAGGAKGLEPVLDADIDHWRWMWETNVLGTLHMTKALLPRLIDSGDGLIVTITSIAALRTYDGGAGYTSAKHAQGAAHRTLRGELLGTPVRLTEVCPGMVETEFSKVRFDGDEERADAVYAGVMPLVAQDIAEIVGFVASRPAHVDLDRIVVRPRDQAPDGRVHRRL